MKIRKKRIGYTQPLYLCEVYARGANGYILEISTGWFCPLSRKKGKEKASTSLNRFDGIKVSVMITFGMIKESRGCWDLDSFLCVIFIYNIYFLFVYVKGFYFIFT